MNEPGFGLADAHVHLADAAYDVDRALVIARARRAGVEVFCCCGLTVADGPRLRAVAAEAGGVAAVGQHPWRAADLDESTLADALAAIREQNPDTIGEIGLDATRAATDAQREHQRRVFRAQLALARELDVPVVLHAVRAMPEVLTILRRDGLPRRGGMVHAWSAPPDLADDAVAAGLYLSFSPLVLKPRAARVRAAAARVPPDRQLVETDAPSGAGVDRTEPRDLPAVVAEIAALRGVASGVVAASSREAFRSLFRR